MYMRRVIALGGLLSCGLLLTATAAAFPAHAGTAQCESASADPQDITTAVCLTGSGVGGGSLPSLTGYTPPPCWLEPRYSPPGLDTYLTGLFNESSSEVGSEGATYYAALYNHYDGLTPPFYVGRTGEWWGVACQVTDLNAASDAQRIYNATGMSVWVPWEYEPPSVPGAQRISTKILAAYAAAQMSLPVSPKPQLSPTGKQTVGLATWVWGTVLKQADLSITASLGNLSSTVTAVPTSVTITPGGPANESSFTCPLHKTAQGWTFGTAYSANATSSCTFKYTRPTAAGHSYDVTVQVHWTATWVGQGETWGLPATPNGTATTVQEIEAVVGGN